MGVVGLTLILSAFGVRAGHAATYFHGLGGPNTYYDLTADWSRTASDGTFKNLDLQVHIWRGSEFQVTSGSTDFNENSFCPATLAGGPSSLYSGCQYGQAQLVEETCPPNDPSGSQCTFIGWSGTIDVNSVVVSGGLTSASVNFTLPDSSGSRNTCTVADTWTASGPPSTYDFAPGGWFPSEAAGQYETNTQTRQPAVAQASDCTDLSGLASYRAQVAKSVTDSTLGTTLVG